MDTGCTTGKRYQQHGACLLYAKDRIRTSCLRWTASYSTSAGSEFQRQPLEHAWPLFGPLLRYGYGTKNVYYVRRILLLLLHRSAGMNALGLSQREWLNTYAGLETSSARAHDLVESSSISLDRWIDHSSSAFGPEFMVADALPDVVLATPDQVHLHVHLRRLLHASANSFAGLLADVPQDRTIAVLERSHVLLIALRVLYGLPCLHLYPALDDVELAIGALLKYGIDLRRLALPSLPLYQLVLSFSSSHPIDAYCISARYDLEEVAVAISSGLLVYDLSVLPDALAAKMGPVYYKRLTDLQRLRQSALRELLEIPLDSHPPSPFCDDDGQRQLETIWKAAIVKAVWHGSFDIIAQSVLRTYEEERTTTLCLDCKSMLEERMQDAARKWATVKHVTEHA